ncbi:MULTISPECIES: hypothetical protein [Roseivirga]|uniref:VLRF1 domain-containing protein n=1 Tax=Roseivirga thermotolerans TaxID=1758176 RepID=A0ABQ3I4C1_9BACT|nr:MULTISPECIES: hypothetical protein [Roseivirga]MEC7753967.1 hypothetical protein [Bacteroidota bacterium]GHE61592.1 hypothetical protein GCM10011340_15760 [Roseivirga thermotolerans]|tara:strand:- start:3488 stop:4153 length:666 start_codon:yes stop_codon:yes gene_type:complete
MDVQSKFLKRDAVVEVVQELYKASVPMSYDFEKHRLEWEQEGLPFSFRLPITLFFEPNGQMQEQKVVKYLMLLVQTGSASVGVFNGEDCLSHKVFTAYMVRKKQGKSQIKHLKTKGKSRAGSRIRLASGIEFFENINERVSRHFQEHEFDRIAFSCSKILLPHLFGAKIQPPFEKKDERLYKIPKHLHQPTFEVMLGMQRFINQGELILPAVVDPDDLFYL